MAAPLGYVYADPDVCHCVLVGNPKAYQAFQQLSFQKKLADEYRRTAQLQADAAFDWNLWAPGFWARRGRGGARARPAAASAMIVGLFMRHRHPRLAPSLTAGLLLAGAAFPRTAAARGFIAFHFGVPLIVGPPVYYAPPPALYYTPPATTSSTACGSRRSWRSSASTQSFYIDRLIISGIGRHSIPDTRYGLMDPERNKQ
jgi:hypothetical protein